MDLYLSYKSFLNKYEILIIAMDSPLLLIGIGVPVVASIAYLILKKKQNQPLQETAYEPVSPIPE